MNSWNICRKGDAKKENPAEKKKTETPKPTEAKPEFTLEEIAADPSAFAFTLSGHNSHPEMNGRYDYDGDENGKPKYATNKGLRRMKQDPKKAANMKVFWTGGSWDPFWGGYSPEA